MWKFLGKKFGRSSGASSRSQSAASSLADLRGKFYLEKHCTHGFPLAPTCMTFDPYRRVLFIGTASGELRMLGQSGVELTGMHDDINKVVQILPFANEESVITISSNNLMHKWSLVDKDGNSKLVLKRTYKFQGGLAKTITVCCLPPFCDCLFVGTLGGITYPMDTEFDGMSPEVLSWSRARAYLKYKGKDVPGEVRCLEICPTNHKQLLIGYEHSYLELWDALSWKPITIFGPCKDAGDLLSMCWHSDGKRFLTSHCSGTICSWDTSTSAKPYMSHKLHGGQLCQDISRIFWPSENLMVMSGGGPIDKVDGYSATVKDSEETVTLQMTSRVIGMHILEDAQADRDSGIVNSGPEPGEGTSTVRRVLVLLLEQEILFIDLRLPEFPLLQPPYLYSMHNSPVKSVELHSNVSRDLWQILSQVGRVQQEAVYRARAKNWPIDGGSLSSVPHDRRDLIMSGHEDGTVKFWDIRELSMRLLYVVKCSYFFTSLDSDFTRADSDSPEDGTPICRQVGFWDPRSDDDQMMVMALHFNGDQLVVGFQGGIALLFHINNQTANINIQLASVTIMRDDPRKRSRNWQAPLEVRTDSVECSPGYQPFLCVSLFPNVSVTALAIAKESHLLGVGCIYGFCIIDYFKNTVIHSQATYIAAQPDQGPLSRLQSIRRSFRQSIKRLNMRHSMRGLQSTQQSYRPALNRSGSTRPSRMNRGQGVKAGDTATGGGATGGGVPAENQPLRRDTVRTIAFTAPCHLTGHSSVYSVLIGTNQGGVHGFTIDIPSAKHRDTRSPIILPIEREFNIKKNHAALFLGVIDSHNYLLDVNDRGSYHAKGGQYLVVCTEDCLKVVSLPHLKKKFRMKLKQSDEDELHIISAHYLRVSGQSAMLLMDSEGFISVYSLPDLRLLYKEDCVDASDAIGQRQFVCSRTGVLAHQRSPSEFTRGSITEDARMEFHFTVPARQATPPPPLTPASLSNCNEYLVEIPSPIKSPTSVPNTESPMETKGVNIDFSDGDFGGSPPAVDTFREIAL